MNSTRSMFCFFLLLSAISAAIVGLMIGCSENKIDTPLTGPAAGSGPVGGGDSQKMKLTANPSSTIVVYGDAQATAKVTALVNNSIGQPMPDGTPVYWEATVGTLDASTQTTSNGAATVTLTFPASYSGCSTVSAESGDVSSSITLCVSRREATPTPTITPTPSKSLIVSAANSNIPHKGSTKISAYVTTNGQPQKGIQVKFSTSGGGALSQSAALTDENGYAYVTFTGNNTSASDVTATINASTEDGRTGSVSVIVGTGATPTPTATPATVITSMTILGSAPPYVFTNGDPAPVIEVTAATGVFPATGTVNFTRTCSRATLPAESFLSSSTGTLVGGTTTVTFNPVNTSGSPGETEYCTVTATVNGASANITITVNP